MKKAVALLALLGSAALVAASAHGPVFGLATPTNSQSEWNFDAGAFGRANGGSSRFSFRSLIGYGFTPYLTLSVTLPTITGAGKFPPTRIQPGDDFDATLAWRFQHNTTKVGTRIESTLFAGAVVPGPRSGFPGIAFTSNAPGTMGGAVTGLASRSNYIWLGSTYTKFYQRRGDRRPDVLDYSLVYGYRPPSWRKEPDKWDWRLFAELVGERSPRFLSHGAIVPETQAHQVFLGPSALGIHNNYTVSFGVQFPVYQDVGARFARERVRYAVNVSYLLFRNPH